MKNKGFTLIELLVVIAIISLLSSIVVASLNTARSKAADAVIIANLNGVRTAAEIEFGENQYYGDEATDCYSSMFNNIPTIKKAIEQIALKMENDEDLKCFVSRAGSSWSIEVKLLSSNETYCIDSTGLFGERYVAVDHTWDDMTWDNRTYCLEQ